MQYLSKLCVTPVCQLLIDMVVLQLPATSLPKTICELLHGRSVLVPYQLWNWCLADMVSMNSNSSVPLSETTQSHHTLHCNTKDTTVLVLCMGLHVREREKTGFSNWWCRSHSCLLPLWACANKAGHNMERCLIHWHDTKNVFCTHVLQLIIVCT